MARMKRTAAWLSRISARKEICLTLLGLSFSLAGRKTAGPSILSADPEARGAAPAALTGGSDAKTDLPSAPAGEPAEENASRESTESVADGTLSGSRFTEESPAPALLHVYVCGSVNRPEVYVLPEGSRITDAVRAAGGFTEDAARDSWNLAELLTDGEMILIPSEEEWAAAGKCHRKLLRFVRLMHGQCRYCINFVFIPS